jgi:hypothetical protein
MSVLDDLKSHLVMMDDMRRRMHRSPAVVAMPYASLEGYVLVNGQEFHSASLTKPERTVVREAMGLSGSEFEIKQCYSNSQALVLADPTGSLRYAEGYVIKFDLPFPIHHGWAVLNGNVIDLTCRVHGAARTKGRLGDRVLGIFTDRIYFGCIFPTEEVRRAVFQRRFWGSLLDDWQNDFPYLRGQRW